MSDSVPIETSHEDMIVWTFAPWLDNRNLIPISSSFQIDLSYSTMRSSTITGNG